MAAYSKDPRENLKKIETMLADIGAPSPAQAAQQHVAARAASRSTLSQAQQAKDCLAAESKLTLYGTSSPRRSGSLTPSMMPGAHMAGKDRADKRYFGGGFGSMGESPGPVYDVEQALSESRAGGQGLSFSRAPRYQGDRSVSCTPGPNLYQLPPSVGRQPTSTASNAAKAVFAKADRFNPKEYISRAHSRNSTSTDSPAPTAYNPRSAGGIGGGPAAVFTGAKSAKQYISAGHVVDSLGEASPGPIYDVSKVDASKASKFKSAPSFTFGGSFDGGPLEKDDDDVVVADSGDRCSHERGPDGKLQRKCLHSFASQRNVVRRTKAMPFISREHSKVQGSTDTPGPAFYAPSDSTRHPRSASAVFTRDHGAEKRFFSRELSTQHGKDSPGPIYDMDAAQSMHEKHKAAATFAPVKGVVPMDRFSGKLFLGKGLGNGMGVESPGPIYDVEKAHHEDGPAYTIVGKERVPVKGVFPGPSRVRWVSQELAAENLGAFSPGPKYDTRPKAPSGPQISFGVSDRYFGDNFPPAHKEKFGTAEKPYTCPADARFVSATFSRLAIGGKSSPGPQNPNVNPTDVACSTTKRVTGPRFAPPAARKLSPPKSSSPGLDGSSSPRDEQPTVMLYPKYEFGKPAAPSVAFPTAKRHVGADAAGGESASCSTASASAGPYDVKYHLTERSSPAIGFGGL